MYIYASDQDQDIKTFYLFFFSLSRLDLVNIRNCECCLYREKSAGWWWGNVLRHSLFYRDQVSLWLLICCRGGYWLSNKMFPPNKCFHYISIIDGAWVERWDIVTNQTNTNSPTHYWLNKVIQHSCFILLFSGKFSQFHRAMLDVLISVRPETTQSSLSQPASQ